MVDKQYTLVSLYDGGYFPSQICGDKKGILLRVGESLPILLYAGYGKEGEIQVFSGLEKIRLELPQPLKEGEDLANV